MTELRSAWRNLRARGWRAALTVALLALALAANTIIFSAADSLVFNRVAYPHAAWLISFETRDPKTGRPGGGFVAAAGLDEWRKQTDLFTAVHGHLYKTIFLSGRGEPELARAAEFERPPDALRAVRESERRRHHPDDDERLRGGVDRLADCARRIAEPLARERLRHEHRLHVVAPYIVFDELIAGRQS